MWSPTPPICQLAHTLNPCSFPYYTTFRYLLKPALYDPTRVHHTTFHKFHPSKFIDSIIVIIGSSTGEQNSTRLNSYTAVPGFSLASLIPFTLLFILSKILPPHFSFITSSSISKSSNLRTKNRNPWLDLSFSLLSLCFLLSPSLAAPSELRLLFVVKFSVILALPALKPPLLPTFPVYTHSLSLFFTFMLLKSRDLSVVAFVCSDWSCSC